MRMSGQDSRGWGRLGQMWEAGWSGQGNSGPGSWRASVRKGLSMNLKLQNEVRGGCLQAAQVPLLGSFKSRVGPASATHFQSGSRISRYQPYNILLLNSLNRVVPFNYVPDVHSSFQKEAVKEGNQD